MQSRKWLGIVLLIAAVGCWACGDTGAKWLNAFMSPLEIVSLRYVISFALVVLFQRPWRNVKRLRTRRPALQIVRAITMLGATASGFAAMHYISLTENTSILFSSPLLIALLAGPFLGEWIGMRRLIAVIVGFGGVLVITRPGAEGGLPPAALFSVAAAIQMAIFAIVTRKLAGHDDSETTMFLSTMIGALIVTPVLIFVWTPPGDAHTWIVILLMSIFGTLGHWLLVLSHKHAPASTLAPFFYTQLLFATIAGFIVFNNVPDGWTLTGAAIIVASGLYLLHRERIRHVPPSEEMPV